MGKRNYQDEYEKRKTMPISFSCPMWLYGWLKEKKNRTDTIVTALERQHAAETNPNQMIRYLQEEKKQHIKKANEIADKIKHIQEMKNNGM